MKYILNIQSISDIITNSSSEVFICSINDNPDTLVQEIQELLDTLSENLGYDERIAYVNVVNESGSDKWYDYSWNKGDILIESTSDNSIPYPIMELLEDLKYTPKFEDRIINVERHHLG